MIESKRLILTILYYKNKKNSTKIIVNFFSVFAFQKAKPCRFILKLNKIILPLLYYIYREFILYYIVFFFFCQI